MLMTQAGQEGELAPALFISQISNFKFTISNFKFTISNFEFQISKFKSQIPNPKSQIYRISHFSN